MLYFSLVRKLQTISSFFRIRTLRSINIWSNRFFASVSSFRELFDPANDPEVVAIDFYFSRVYDQSAMEAIDKLAERYRQEGKRLHLQNLNADCRQRFERAGNLLTVDIDERDHLHITQMI